MPVNAGPKLIPTFCIQLHMRESLVPFLVVTSWCLKREMLRNIFLNIVLHLRCISIMLFLVFVLQFGISVTILAQALL